MGRAQQGAMRAAAKKPEQAIQALQLYRQGLTFQAIGAELGISKSRAHQLYWKAIRDLDGELREQARFALTETIDRENHVISRMAEILCRPCFVCEGNDTSCPRCEGHGYLHDAKDRIAAAHALQRSSEHVARLFNLHRHAVELSVTRDFLAEVEQLSDDQLEKEIALFATRVNEVQAALPPAVEDES